MTRYLIVSAFVVTVLACNAQRAEDMSSTEGASLIDEVELSSEDGLQDLDDPSANAIKVLIFGELPPRQAALRSALESLGHNVTVVGALPNNLLPYNTIWHVGAEIPLTAAERSRLIDFVNAGGGLHLTGERACCDLMNASLGALINSLVVGGGITVGSQGDVRSTNNKLFYPYEVNQTAFGGIATTPKSAANLRLLQPGGLNGVAGENVLLKGWQNKPVGAVWGSEDLIGGAGTVTIIMDNDWFGILAEGDNRNLLENLQTFLNGNPNEAPIADAGGNQSINCAPAGGTTAVRLDGSGSTDPDNDPLTYSWFLGNTSLGGSVTPTIPLGPGTHTITLIVSDGRLTSTPDTVQINVIECPVNCTRPPGVFEHCTPECPCPHGEGDCDEDIDCEAGLRCLHDPGPGFGYPDPETDVCSTDCPTIGVGAWNYCTPNCPCAAGQGDCETNADCEAGLVCASDVGPNYGYQVEVDVCQPPDGV